MRALTTSRARLTYVALALATIAVGLLVVRSGASIPVAFRDKLGDALWALMMLWWVSAIVPRAARGARGAIALVICFAVELSQLYTTPALDTLRRTLFGRLVLGSGFDAFDLVAYSVGVAVAVAMDALIRRHPPPR